MPKVNNSEMIRTLVEIKVLTSVSKKPRYGAEILKLYKTTTPETAHAVIYSTLNKLEEKELVTSKIDYNQKIANSHGGLRKYYTITTKGEV